MVNYNEQLNLPSSEELPDSDGEPVDSEMHILVAFLLREILNRVWGDRSNWFFGVNMGIYHTTGSNVRIPIVPDCFLSLGVPSCKNNKLRPSYVLWEENYIVPVFVLEIVAEPYRGEYDEKMIDYARLGVLYYAIYSPDPDYTKRDKHERFEVYRLLNGAYQRLQGNPVWMPEIGLGIGTEVGNYYRYQRELLYWYDSEGNRFMTPEERELQERQRAEQLEQEVQQERQRAEQLEQMLRSLGVDPEQL
ncbi:MAG: Uma2 family endonuclease [Okeania sp. SIO3I5]|uniref:Uma2 family endonuclease n=1 Tax=Okeania sp. SIO3I5 TaxID=2607805 RepID=UPI0013BCACBF|nr:Uma2 family endonuclease [Okeania sp. SIO3I5]NEQ35547.1 Uma2 family endonuclease [Okeania sp. SIO3I5]